jgi:hypothetical protein
MENIACLYRTADSATKRHHQTMIYPNVESSSKFLRRILKRVLCFGGCTPRPKYLRSGKLASPRSSKISISKQVDMIARLISISCLAKCRPGHRLWPPPYGSQDPVRPSSENFTPGFLGKFCIIESTLIGGAGLVVADASIRLPENDGDNGPL